MSKNKQVIVVGSGPAGLAATAALLEQGAHVLMVDGGLSLEQNICDKLRLLSAKDKANWPKNVVEDIKGNMKISAEGVEKKLSYGSDYPYRLMDDVQPVRMSHAKVVRSLARSGLANVWGASVMPMADDDFSQWPISPQTMKPHYQSVSELMTLVSSAEGTLPERFPHSGEFALMHYCSQAQSFLGDLKAAKEKLTRAGIYYGHSRLAFEKRKEDSKECAYCGMCLYGCPLQLIFNGDTLLKQFRDNPNFSYLPGIIVNEVQEEGDSIFVLGKSLDDQQSIRLKGAKVFLAGGFLSTTRIILRSAGMFGIPVAIKHSDHFQIPLLRFKNTHLGMDEALFTLNQLGIVIDNDDVCEHPVFMQVYCYNDMYPRVLESKLPAFPGKSSLLRSVLGRLLIVKGYLHSSVSSSLTATLLGNGSEASKSTLEVVGVENPLSKHFARRAVHHLARHAISIRTLPAIPALRMGVPGEGNHSGGSFPMGNVSDKFGSDPLGRPLGYRNVHAVDASVMPSIPATTITYTAMANAHRIGTLAIQNA